MICDARIRPFPVGNDTDIACERDDHHTQHRGTLRDYAHAGSATVVSWDEWDRRTFRGGWPGRCQKVEGCTLPVGHRGKCAR